MHSEAGLQLVQILEKTISPDKNELETAQKYLEHAAETNLSHFIKMLSDVLVHGGNSQVARMAAGLQLKNHLTSKDLVRNNQYQQRWLSFPHDVKAYIKKNILSALGTESCRPSSAAQCVAYVAVVELPVEQWNELIPHLVDNVVNLNSTELKKEASLEAIGYICQDINSDVLIEQCNQILTAIIHGMRSSEPSTHVRLAATVALNNSLEFTKANFDKENERNFIMEVVCEATQSLDRRISVSALQCLVKILSLYYQFMEPYMPGALFPITLEAMRSDIDEVALQGIEFWSSISEEEIDLANEASDEMDAGFSPIRISRHYARSALEYITPVLLHKLTKQEDSDEWNPPKAASVCLILLSNCCSNDVLPFVLPFIDENIQSSEWRLRDAAVMAFGSVLGGLKTETLIPLIDQAMPTLIERMYDNVVAIKDTAAWTLNRVCEVCPEAALNEKYFKPLMECLLNGLTGEPSVAATVCFVITCLSEAAFKASKPNDMDFPDTSIMSEYFNFTIQQLLQNSDRADASQHNLRTAAYEALMVMVKNAPNDCYSTVQQITMVILDRLQKVLQMDNHISCQSDRNQYYDLQSLLCATLQSILKRITPEDAPKISDAVMGALLTMLSSSSGKEGGIQEDALMTAGYLAEALNDKFLKYMDSFKDYLYLGLKNRSDHKVCGTAVGLVGDICRAIKNNVLPYCDEFMTLLLENLQDSTIDQSIKPQIFWVFGDIALVIGPEFMKYLDIVMKMLLQASQVPMVHTDIDRRDHLNRLRESILEAYTGIIQGFKGDERKPRAEISLVQPYVPDIIHFMIVIAEEPMHTDNQVAIIAGLVGDLCQGFGPPSLQLLDVQPIINILQQGKRSGQDRIVSTVNWASKELRELKKSISQAVAS
ncbi:importin subunit beta Fs(2)Ket isoform X2 [Arctopsyche grandis]